MTSGFLRRAATAAAVVAMAAGAVSVGGVGAGLAHAEDPKPAFTIDNPDILESSGLAASNVHPGTYYTVNDSGSDARIYAIDAKGETEATLTMRNVEPYDWEAIASGPEGRIWVGDIGDNDRVRERVTLYRFKEPTDLTDQRLQWSRFRFRYTNGARDAETLLVHPRTGRVYVVSKTLGGGAIYAGPEEPSSDSINSLEKIADAPSVVTDGAFLPDGSAIVLRNYSNAYVMSWPDAKTIRTIPLPQQDQGESLAVSNDGKNILVGSEGSNSAVYSLPVSGDAPPPATATPKPKDPTPSPSVSSQTNVVKRDDGVNNSLFGGMSLWVLLSIAAIALVAGIAAFPRTGRGRRPHPPRERGGGGGPRERRPPPSPRREPAPAGSGSGDGGREPRGGRDSASFGPGPYRPRRTPRPPGGRPGGQYGGGGPGPGYSPDPRYPSDPRYPDDSRY